MNHMCRFCSFVLVAACLYGMQTGPAWAGVPDLPRADTCVDHLVPETLATKIATSEARRMWGDVTCGTPIVCTDMDGKINYYMVPFRIGGDRFPGVEEISANRRASLRRIHSLLSDFRPDYGAGPAESLLLEADTDSQGSDVRGPVDVPAERPDGTPSHRIEYQRALERLREEVSESAEDRRYGTIMISARRDRYPIPAVYHFLAPFFMTGEEALELAQADLGFPGCPLENLLFLGPGELFYRFVGAGREVLVNCKTLAVIRDVEGFRAKVEAIRTDGTLLPHAEAESRRHRIEEAWTRLIGEARQTGEEGW
jgi:hypothetical protein